MLLNEQPEFEVVRGIVLPTVWGAKGEPRLVAILTSDEGEYDVAPTMAGEELLSHLREEVEARVLVKTGQKDRKTITVVSFNVVGVSSPDNGADKDALYKPLGSAGSRVPGSIERLKW